MSNPVQDLENARSALVATRRELAKLLAGAYKRGKTEEATEKLIQIQKAIEAIDRAMVDEKRSALANNKTLKNFSPDDPFSKEVPGG